MCLIKKVECLRLTGWIDAGSPSEKLQFRFVFNKVFFCVLIGFSHHCPQLTRCENALKEMEHFQWLLSEILFSYHMSRMGFPKGTVQFRRSWYYKVQPCVSCINATQSIPQCNQCSQTGTLVLCEVGLWVLSKYLIETILALRRKCLRVLQSVNRPIHLFDSRSLWIISPCAAKKAPAELWFVILKPLLLSLFTSPYCSVLLYRGYGHGTRVLLLRR